MSQPTPEAKAPEAKARRPTRQWLALAVLVLALAYLIAFIVENRKRVSVDWVFGTTHTSLIWALIVTFLTGTIVGASVSYLYRRRRRRRSAAQ